MRIPRKALFLVIPGIAAVLMLVWAFCAIYQPIYSSAPPSDRFHPANQEELKKHIAFLTDSSHPRSYPNFAELDRAADYILKQFRMTNGAVTEQKYQVDGSTVRNIIVRFGPETGPRIVVGAHYDAFGGLPGADDNASGIAGLIELAKMLDHGKTNSTIELVAYTLEEPPFFRTPEMGSMVHAKSLKEKHVDVRAMVCLEMIGYFTSVPNSQQYPAPGMTSVYPSTGDFIAVVSSMKPGDRELVRKIKSSMTVDKGGVPVYSLNGPASLPG